MLKKKDRDQNTLFIVMLYTVVLALSSLVFNVNAAPQTFQQVKVAAPYLEMYVGPGEGYPIFHVMERGSVAEILIQKANWYKVRNQKNIEGWVPYEQISQTTALNGDKIQFTQLTQEDFSERNWEWGALGGDFGGAPIFSVYGSYLFNKSFATEVSVSQSIGDVSSSTFFKFGFIMQPFPEWEYSPYFLMGTGLINVQPAATLVQPVEQSNQISNISFGVRTHLTQQIIMRMEYSEYVIFSATKDNDDNEDIKEWKVGFAIFF